MPVSYQFLTHTVQLDVEGVFTAEDIVRTMREIMNDGRAKSGINLLSDLRHANAGTVITDQIKLGTQRALPLFSFFDNQVFLVVETPLQFGLSRMFEIYAGNYGIRVTIFKSLEQAYEYLGESLENSVNSLAGCI
jgi:hypothetical protein